jgi:hypothetical protein
MTTFCHLKVCGPVHIMSTSKFSALKLWTNVSMYYLT